MACGLQGSVVAWSGETTEFPGRVQFSDPVTLAPQLAASSFGPNPVDVDVTDDRLTVAVACAGDPPFVGGGEALGYVTVYRVPPGGPSLMNESTDIARSPSSPSTGRRPRWRRRGSAGSPTRRPWRPR